MSEDLPSGSEFTGRKMVMLTAPAFAVILAVNVLADGTSFRQRLDLRDRS